MHNIPHRNIAMYFKELTWRSRSYIMKQYSTVANHIAVFGNIDASKLL